MTDAQPPRQRCACSVHHSQHLGRPCQPYCHLGSNADRAYFYRQRLGIHHLPDFWRLLRHFVSLPQKTPATYPLQSHLQTMHPYVKCALSLSHQFTTYCRDRERDTTMLWLCSISKRKILQTHIACINAFKYKDILLPDAAGWTCAWVLCGYG